MSTSQPAAGHQTTLSFLHEDDGFAQTPTDDDPKPFGYDATLSTFDGSHNAVRVFDPNSREAARVIEQEFSGSFTVDATLANPWWLQEIFGAPDTTGLDPSTHTYGANTGGEPTTMRIRQGNDGTGFRRILAGAVATDVTVDFNVPGEISLSITGAYADEPSDATVESQPAVQREPLMTHHASMTRGGTTLELVQSVTVSIATNDAMIYDLGSRTPATNNPKALEYDLDYTKVVTSSDDVERFYGNDTTLQESIDNTADIVIDADNGKTGSALNRLSFELDDVFPGEHSRSGVGDPQADLEDQLSEISPTVTVIAENDDGDAR